MRCIAQTYAAPEADGTKIGTTRRSADFPATGRIRCGEQVCRVAGFQTSGPLGLAHRADSEIGIQQVGKLRYNIGDALAFLDAICHGPIMHLVKPDMVLEVAFNSIQPSTRHVSGLALRFLRIKAIRRDKNVDSIDTLRYARDLAQQRANLPRI